MTESEVFEWVKKNDLTVDGLFTKAIKVGEIDEGEVFSLGSDSDEPIFIGLPSFIIVKGDEIRNVYGKEAFRIIDKLYLNDCS